MGARILRRLFHENRQTCQHHHANKNHTPRTSVDPRSGAGLLLLSRRFAGRRRLLYRSFPLYRKRLLLRHYPKFRRPMRMPGPAPHPHSDPSTSPKPLDPIPTLTIPHSHHTRIKEKRNRQRDFSYLGVYTYPCYGGGEETLPNTTYSIYLLQYIHIYSI